MNQFPPSPRVFHLDRFEYFRKFAEIFASQGAPPVSTTLVANLPLVSAAGINDTGGKFFLHFCLRCWYRRQICHRCQRYRRQICHRCQRRRWQIMSTISGFRYHKVNLKSKIFIYVNSTTQRCPNKIIKIFLLEGSFHLPPVSLTPVANLELRISREFRKNSKRP